jgi:hypothetical protein
MAVTKSGAAARTSGCPASGGVKWVSVVVISLGASATIGSVQNGRDAQIGDAMKRVTKYAAPWMAVAALGGAIVLAPIASADTDPLVPYGTEPHSPYILGFHESNHDEANTTNGQLDVPF